MRYRDHKHVLVAMISFGFKYEFEAANYEGCSISKFPHVIKVK
jgi:hypothetical protein